MWREMVPVPSKNLIYFIERSKRDDLLCDNKLHDFLYLMRCKKKKRYISFDANIIIVIE